MFQRLLLKTAILTLSTLMACSLAHAWSEPAIAPVMMTAPLTPPPVTGTTFYVDRASIGGTCNNNNSGTSTSSPWCTIGKAASMLTAGQRAYVRAATYNEGDLHPTNSGTPGNYITFQAYPGESPKINCAGHIFCWDGVSFGWSYVVWNGFEAYSPIQQYFVENSANTHHIWFINGKYHDNGAHYSGFAYFYSNNVFSNNEIYNTGQMAAYTYGAGAHDNIFEFNNVHDNGRNGDDDGAIKCGVNDWNCVIRYNTVWNNYRNPSSASPCFQPGPPPVCQGITGIYLDISTSGNHPGAMSYVYNNISYDNDIGLQANDSTSVRIFNNIVYHNGFTPGFGTFQILFGKGITINNPSTNNIHVYNNTSYGNRDVGLEFWNSPASGVLSRNNLVMNNGIQLRTHAGFANMDFDNDLLAGTSGTLISWNGTNYSSLSSFLARPGNTTETHAVGNAATFVNAAGGDFHLTSASAGKDAGTALTLFTYDYNNQSRPQGPAFDIGAYEYGSGNISPLAPPTNLHIVNTIP